MEEKASLLEKGNPILAQIESRLGTLESSVQEILAKGDEFNEATQEKLQGIQDQLEEHSLNMRKLRRKLGSRYSPSFIACVLVSLLAAWAFFMYSLVGK